jgi:hypothetical protein
LVYKTSLIHYYVFGSGPKTLFCFHGYGEEGSSFAFLEKKLGSIYTMYAIDFPIHGNTQWNEKAPFSPHNLIEILECIHPAKTKNFHCLLIAWAGGRPLHLVATDTTET